MLWARKFLVLIFSLLLFICLVIGTLSLSANLNLTKPAKLEALLGQSHFYTGVVDNALKDAQQNASNDAGAGRVSLSDPEVAQAVKTVFTPSLIQSYTTTFLNSNYAWLQGKTSAPRFTIDLTSAKQQLAQQIGKTVQDRIAGLQACSAAQLTQLQSTLTTDPLTIPCLLPSLSAQTAGAQVTKQIAESSDFLNNPVITASSINPNGDNQGQPYYQKLRHLPKLYQLNQKLPLILGILAVISIMGIFFLSLTRKRGLRRLGVVSLASGIVLVLFKLAADSLSNHLDKKIFSNSNLSQLQTSLTNFLHLLEAQLFKLDFWAGVGMAILGVILLVIAWKQRSQPRPPKTTSGTPKQPEISDEPERRERPPIPPLKRPPPAPPKRSRLIQ